MTKPVFKLIDDDHLGMQIASEVGNQLTVAIPDDRLSGRYDASTHADIAFLGCSDGLRDCNSGVSIMSK